MTTSASSFVGTFNHNRGDLSLGDLIGTEYRQNIIDHTCTENTTTITFTDGSKVVVKHDEATEVPSFNAKPFVKVEFEGVIVYTNNCQEVFVRFLNCEKTIRMSCSNNSELDITGMGKLLKYDGFKVTFK